MITAHSRLPIAPTRFFGSPPPARPALPRWTGFRALFEQLNEHPGAVHPRNPQPALARTRSPFSPPGAAVRSLHIAGSQGKPPLEQTRSAAALGANAADPPPPNGATASNLEPSGPNLDGYVPISEAVSLKPLFDTMERAGLALKGFSFDELEATTTFPDRPELDFTTHQLLIRGPHGSGLFDIGLALRSPFVTVTELRSYDIA